MTKLPAGNPENDPSRIALQNEARRLELELEACQRDASRLRVELEAARLSQADTLGELLANRQESLFEQVAAPVSQLLTQVYLLEAGRPLQARDVAAVASRIVTALQNAGLTIEGRPGEVTAFDPDRHSPLSAASTPEPGQKVVVRFAGVRYLGKVLQRAGVETAEEDA